MFRVYFTRCLRITASYTPCIKPPLLYIKYEIKYVYHGVFYILFQSNYFTALFTEKVL